MLYLKIDLHLFCFYYLSRGRMICRRSSSEGWRLATCRAGPKSLLTRKSAIQVLGRLTALALWSSIWMGPTAQRAWKCALNGFRLQSGKRAQKSQILARLTFFFFGLVSSMPGQLDAKVNGLQILLFNCMPQRDPRLLLPRLMNTCSDHGNKLGSFFVTVT